MARRKRRSELQKLPRKVAILSGSSIMVGAGAKAAAPFGATYVAPMAEVGSMMRPVASISMMKTQVGMLGELQRTMKPKRRKRR